MTVTTLHETGSYEGFDKTIAYHLDQNWNTANTDSKEPYFYSASGTGVSHSWPSTGASYEIHCNLDEMEIPDGEANGDTWHRMKSIVYIDIFAHSADLLKLTEREVNRIIWDALKPNASTRLTKSDGSSVSAINTFDKTTILWRKERWMKPEQELYAHSSGQLTIIWYQTRS